MTTSKLCHTCHFWMLYSHLCALCLPDCSWSDVVTGEIYVYNVCHTEIYVEFTYQRSCVCQKEMLHQHTLWVFVLAVLRNWRRCTVCTASRNFSTNSHRSLTMQYDLPWHVLPMINVTHVFCELWDDTRTLNSMYFPKRSWLYFPSTDLSVD